MSLKKLPRPVKSFLLPVIQIFAKTHLKNYAELNFWYEKWEQENHKLSNAHYEKIFLAMAGEKDTSFLDGKIIADFGCGPRGSLCWAKSASKRIGIDVLADKYEKFEISKHNIEYIKNTEKLIPLPSDYVDILFTLNAIDHVSNFDITCKEIVRIIKLGGELIGSFNLNEPKSASEPQTLTEKITQEELLQYFDIILYRIKPQGPNGDYYHYFFDDSNPVLLPGDPKYLWVRAKKK
ncbi:MAG: methyltransferase domain-containing protein [Candidatus Cloacimonetes bacterium]|nr:methyltransferase domain-containing protein [Candidatus Cloacimonadota bacterium]